MRQIAIIIIFTVINNLSIAQQIPKKITAIRIEKAPRIDGEIEAEIWEKIPASGDFKQFSPRFDAEVSHPTEIKIAYDNTAIYISAFMYDSSPDSILKQLTQRDETGNADQISLAIDTYNDDQHAFAFSVTAAGVQIDERIGPNIDEDEASDFDVVWESAVKINEKGWVAEIKIPFSAIRFPGKNVQEWGVNFKRVVRRLREESLWSQTPATAQNIVPYFGEITGLNNIKPPLRLFVTPYLGTTLSHYPINIPSKNNLTSSYSAGADVKYGINESFTLDMILVPDFGQVPSDPQVLNLTPFEVQFEENRDFFKEGIDLFNQGRLFYPRRIGQTPGGFDQVQSLADDGLKVISNPAQVRLLNATKISGRTPTGLGLGILNAITAKTEARLKTVSGIDSVIITEPFSNYNVIALNQTLKNNSSVSLINTNVFRKDIIRNNANVTGFGFTIGNKTNTYSLQGFTAISQKMLEKNVSNGFKYTLEYGKINGNFQFNISQVLESDKFNPNDLGILRAPDEFSNSAEFSYSTFQPRGIFLKTNTEIEFNYATTYKGMQYQQSGLELSSNATFKNFLFGLLRFETNAKSNDFFEARTPGRIFKNPAYFGFINVVSSDYRKKFAADLESGYYDFYSIRRPFFFIEFEPRYRFNDRFSLTFEHRFEKHRTRGFTDKVGTNIVFAERLVKTDETRLEGSYNFNANMSVSLNARYYWSRVKNIEYKLLDNKGYLTENTIGYNKNNNQNANFFNADLIYRWRFAPGSDLFVVYKNNIQDFQNQIQSNYLRNVKSVFNSDQQNTLSVKVLYFLDFLYFKKRFKN